MVDYMVAQTSSYSERWFTVVYYIICYLINHKNNWYWDILVAYCSSIQLYIFCEMEPAVLIAGYHSNEAAMFCVKEENTNPCQ